MVLFTNTSSETECWNHSLSLLNFSANFNTPIHRSAIFNNDDESKFCYIFNTTVWSTVFSPSSSWNTCWSQDH